MHFLALADNSPSSTLPSCDTFTQGSHLSRCMLARASLCKACPMDIVLKVIYLLNIIRPAPCNVFSFIFLFGKRKTKMSSLPAKCNFCNYRISSLDTFFFFPFACFTSCFPNVTSYSTARPVSCALILIN